MLGTPEYMSPEQIQGQPVDRRSDLYSAGILLYRMLSGELPYEASSEFGWYEAHVRMAPDLETLRTSGSDALVAVVKKALSKQPAERWRTAEDMNRALAPLRAGGGESMAQVGAAQAALERLVAAQAQKSEHVAAVEEASRKARVRAASDRVAIAQAEAQVAVIRAKARASGHGPLWLVALAVLVLSIVGLGVSMTDDGPDPQTQDGSLAPQTQGDEVPSLGELNRILQASQISWKNVPAADDDWYEETSRETLAGLKIASVRVLKSPQRTVILGASDNSEGPRALVLFHQVNGKWRVKERVLFQECAFDARLKLHRLPDQSLLVANKCVLNAGNGRCVGTTGIFSIWTVAAGRLQRVYQHSFEDPGDRCDGMFDVTYAVTDGGSLTITTKSRGAAGSRTKVDRLKFRYSGREKGMTRR